MPKVAVKMFNINLCFYRHIFIVQFLVKYMCCGFFLSHIKKHEQIQTLNLCDRAGHVKISNQLYFNSTKVQMFWATLV